MADSAISGRQWTHRLRRFTSNKLAGASAVVLFVVVIVALMAPLIAPYPPLKTGVSPALIPPSATNLLGTDDLGRDGFSEIVFGARTALTVGGIAGFVALVIGILLGCWGGLIGGRVDDFLMRVVEAFQVLPVFFVMLVIASVFGPSTEVTALVLGLLAVPSVARLVRAEALALREADYVAAGYALGNTHLAVAFRHVIPGVLGTALTVSSLEVAGAILTEAGLSFLGFSDSNVASWGAMLNNSRQFLSSAWWMAVFPGAAVAVVVLSINAVAEGLANMTNPRLVLR